MKFSSRPLPLRGKKKPGLLENLVSKIRYSFGKMVTLRRGSSPTLSVVTAG
jgi:hypothetical protein